MERSGKQRLLMAGVIGVAGALAAVGTVGPADAQHGGSELHFVVQTTATFVDVGQSGESQGDRSAESGTVFDRDGKEVGRAMADCVLVPPPTHYQCAAAILLERGQIMTLGGFQYDPARPFTLAVVGGTGDYAGASGLAEVTTVAGSGYKVDIHLR